MAKWQICCEEQDVQDVHLESATLSETNRLDLTLTNGKVVEVDLSSLAAEDVHVANLSVQGNELVITLTDNTRKTVALPSSEVVLSPDSGNLLQLRDNGLYYGTVAPRSVLNIYVDAQEGNDETGDGTRNNPYRTIKKAWSVKPTGTYSYIYLKEGQTHEWAADGKRLDGRAIQFRPYGGGTDTIIKELPRGESLDWARVAQLNRPTIRVVPAKTFLIGSTTYDYCTVYGTQSPAPGSASFVGIILDTTASATVTTTYNNAALGNSTVGIDLSFTGCVFKLGSDMYLINEGKNAAINISSCKFDDTAGTRFLTIGGAAVMSINADDGKSGKLSPTSSLSYMEATPTRQMGQYMTGVRGVIQGNIRTSTMLGV